MTHEEALSQIELGEMFIVGEEVNVYEGAESRPTRALRGLPIESIHGPAMEGKTVVLCESNGASMTALSHLVQRTGQQPIIVFLEPTEGAAAGDEERPRDSGISGTTVGAVSMSSRESGLSNRTSSGYANNGSCGCGMCVQHDGEVRTLVDMCEEFDGVEDPGLALTRAEAARDRLLNGHLFSAIVSCNRPLPALVHDVVQIVRKETTGVFWGMQSYVLPRGLVSQSPREMPVDEVTREVCGLLYLRKENMLMCMMSG